LVSKYVTNPQHAIDLYATWGGGVTPVLEQLRQDLQGSGKRGQFSDCRTQAGKFALGERTDAPQVRAH
jgi:hypothetical protein